MIWHKIQKKNKVKKNKNNKSSSKITRLTFHKEQQSNVLLPWELPDELKDKEELIKKQVLLLSEEKWSFLNMPEDTEVLRDWEYEFNPDLAQALLKVDPKLDRMRFLLVPYKVKEDPFWKHYFARVHIIKCTIIDPSILPSSTSTFRKSSLPIQKPKIDPFTEQVQKLKETTASSPVTNRFTKKEEHNKIIDSDEDSREEALKKELEDLGEDFDLDIDIPDDLDDEPVDLDDPELEELLNS